MTALEEKLQEAENSIVAERAKLTTLRALLKAGWLSLAINLWQYILFVAGLIAAYFGYISYAYPIGIALGGWGVNAILGWRESTRLHNLHRFELETGEAIRKILRDALLAQEKVGQRVRELSERLQTWEGIPALPIDELSSPSMTLERAIEIARTSQAQVDQLSKRLEWSMDMFDGYKILSEQLRENLAEAARNGAAARQPQKGRPGRPKEEIPQAARDYGIASAEQFRALLAEARAAKQSGRGELGRWCKEKGLVESTVKTWLNSREIDGQ